MESMIQVLLHSTPSATDLIIGHVYLAASFAARGWNRVFLTCMAVVWLTLAYLSGVAP